MDDKNNKVVFITGASGGIGAGVGAKFAKMGWVVAGFYRENKPEDTENIKYFQIDVADEESVRSGVEKAFAEMGRVDALVNCAGIFGNRSLAEYDGQLMDKIMAVNEKGTYWMTKYTAEKMTQGVIVNISSVAGKLGSGTDPIYAATKAAVVAFSKSMAKALAPKIRVNCVAPGVTNSDMVKDRNWVDLAFDVERQIIKKMAEPEDIANAVYFLASDESGHITGICLDVNGGVL